MKKDRTKRKHRKLENGRPLCNSPASLEMEFAAEDEHSNCKKCNGFKDVQKK